MEKRRCKLWIITGSSILGNIGKFSQLLNCIQWDLFQFPLPIDGIVDASFFSGSSSKKKCSESRPVSMQSQKEESQRKKRLCFKFFFQFSKKESV